MEYEKIKQLKVCETWQNKDYKVFKFDTGYAVYIYNTQKEIYTLIDCVETINDIRSLLTAFWIGVNIGRNT